MTQSKMTITAVIPAYNCEKYIARAIDSVLSQTQPPDEVIIVDDGSSDGTIEAVRVYGDKVKLIQQQNGGASAARNTGIKAASGDWIAFLDADDEWLPDMLERQCDVLRRHPDLAWISGNFKLCFCRQGYDLVKDDPARVRTVLNGKMYFDDYFEAFIHRIRGCTDCMMIRRDALQKAGLFCTTLPRANDIDMWLRIAYDHPGIGYTDEPLAIYHMETGDSLAGRHMDYDYIRRFLQKHLDLAKEAGRLDAFKPCAAMMLRDWIRSSFFDDRVYDIRKAVSQFESLVSKRYIHRVRAMTMLPGLTKRLFQALSWISRTFKLRRQRWHTKAKYK